MIITAHIVLAAGINSAVKASLPEAFLIGFISHHLIDLLPHTDAACVWKEEDQEKNIMPLLVKIFIFTDFLISFAFLAWLWWLGKNPYLLFWSSAGAIMPDVINIAIPFWFPPVKEWKIFKWYGKFHLHTLSFQSLGNKDWIFGAVSTILILSFSLHLLL